VYDSQYIAPPTIGPLAKSVQDLETIMKVLCANQQYDFSVPPLPWKTGVQFKKRIGVIRQINWIEPCPTSKRALQQSIEKLQTQGYEIVELNVEDLLEEIVYWSIVVFQKNLYLWNSIKGEVNKLEPLCPLYNMSRMFRRTPDFVLRIMSMFMKDSRKGKLLQSYFDSQKINQYDLDHKIRDYYQIINKVMTNNDISAILMPGLPLPAPKLYSSNNLMIMCCYLFIFNVLNLPAGVVSVATVREDEQYYETQHDDQITKEIHQTMKNSKGLSLGVQVVSRAFHDEVVIEIMKHIEKP
jgi:Asp-tRNA(Asn)/Glu-tRNA(Gln) amidotransferase A subunit family amidase